MSPLTGVVNRYVNECGDCANVSKKRMEEQLHLLNSRKRREIISLPSIEEHQEAETLLALGVRQSEDLQLPQDPLDARLQSQAVDIDEHE